jgi:succinate-semialdehyde dehydrogenase/glutarate-semialdehyde dehydrogenase
MAFESINPATGEVLARFDYWDQDTLDLAVKRAGQKFADWSQRTSMQERCALMHRAADLLRDQKSELAKLITLEMGKSINEAEAEVEKSAWVCEFYAEQGPAYLADELIETDASKSFICYQPLGVVLAVMPWNFPFWQVFRFAAPALVAGNIGLLKHASNVPQCAQAIEKVFLDAGFPEGVFTNLMMARLKSKV